jgi:hypothetical protein
MTLEEEPVHRGKVIGWLRLWALGVKHPCVQIPVLLLILGTSGK